MKRGFFFIADLLVGFVILVVGVVLLLSTNVNEENLFQIDITADDLLDQLFLSRINEVLDDTILELRNESVIGDERLAQSIIQTVIELHFVEGLTENATAIVRSVASDFVPSGANYDFAINDTVFIDQQVTSVDYADAQFAVSQERIFYGINATYQPVGPYVVKVRIWN